MAYRKNKHTKKNEFAFVYFSQHLTYTHPHDKPKPTFQFGRQLLDRLSFSKGFIKCSQRKDDPNVWEFHECIDSTSSETILIGQFDVREVIIEREAGWDGGGGEEALESKLESKVWI